MILLATLRHAETEWSRDKRIQGRTDVPLSPAGRAALRARALPARPSRRSKARGRLR
ncbi:MAG: histidine phosphatase family protein, partial [Burkholderiales bacterium]